jgi:hypothetical protein
MYPELASLLEAMCDLLLALPGDDEQAIASARERVTQARAALRRITGMTIT